ncbi:piggyBac transposable element-derived protein 2-like [Schistocerca serialis cubense]|uniref:piggyBac transposable element-derived protein 2-like n=1 Tax=Schistocerca serialis cubense TaxID=2023355 RepID=UPI00214F1F6C|nr:piggyBac transposable element-derived protein 2-like [Schistocerca serialis cubense]
MKQKYLVRNASIILHYKHCISWNYKYCMCYERIWVRFSEATLGNNGIITSLCYRVMEPNKFYGKRKKGEEYEVIIIPAYESEDSVLDSDCEGDIDIVEKRQGDIIIGESDNDSAEDGDNALLVNNESDNENVSDEFQVNYDWRHSSNRIIRPVQPWKCCLPCALEEPHLPMTYFRQLLDDKIVENAVDQTNLYAIQKDISKPINTGKNETEQFFGCCMYMSIYGLPSSRMYWKTTTQIPAVADVTSRNRWEQLKLGLHFNDNETIDQADTLYKIRPFLEPLVENFRRIPMSEKLSVDEQMIPFKERHTFKNYVKNKPKKWSYKAFVLCDSHGIAHNLEIYSGKVKHDPSIPDVGVSGNDGLRLAYVIPRHMFHKLYFDNWFTGVRLEVELEKMGIQYLGTVRPNRLKGCMFTSDKVMKKKSRESCEEHLSKIDGITLSAVKWYDNKPVHLLSTFAGAHPTSTVERWDRIKKEKINVECPSIVQSVDLLDSLIALYRIKIWSKKWYLRIVFHLLDLTVVNAWILYRRDCTECNVRKLDQLSLLEFKVTVAACLCKQNKDGQKKRGRPSSSSMETAIQLKKKTGSAAPLPEKEVRKDGIGHWPQFSEKRGR